MRKRPKKSNHYKAVSIYSCPIPQDKTITSLWYTTHIALWYVNTHLPIKFVKCPKLCIWHPSAVVITPINAHAGVVAITPNYCPPVIGIRLPPMCHAHCCTHCRGQYNQNDDSAHNTHCCCYDNDHRHSSWDSWTSNTGLSRRWNPYTQHALG